MSFRGRSSGRGRSSRKENDGKYLRLTGLWQSKKNDSLWTGKLRNQDIEKLIEKCDEADKAGADLVVFLWENKEKDGPKDPEFTVQVSVSEDDGNSRGRGRSSHGSSRRDRDNDRDDRDNDNNQDDNQDDDNQDNPEPDKEEKPRGKKSSKREEKEEPRSRRGTAKKDKANDW